MNMKQFANILRRLIGKAPQNEPTEVRSIVIMQRELYPFTAEELRDAGERGWGKKFDGSEDPMFFVTDHPALTVVKAGSHVVRLTSLPHRYSDDDQYALAQLPLPEQKRAWNEHHAHTLLDLFNDFSSSEQRIPDAEAYACLAKLALQLGDPNCTAIFVPNKNIMMPNDGTAEQGLRFMIDKQLP